MAEKDPDSDPGTAAFVPDFDDTGEDSLPFVPNFDDTGSQPLPRVTESKPKDEPEHESESESVAAPVAVPGRYQYVTWWKLLLVLLGVWFAAAEVGLSLFYWWYHTVDKTAAVYMVLVYVVACVVAGVILAMVQGQADDVGAGARSDVGAVCVRCRCGAALRPLLLRAGGPLPGRPHSLLSYPATRPLG